MVVATCFRGHNVLAQCRLLVVRCQRASQPVMPQPGPCRHVATRCSADRPVAAIHWVLIIGAGALMVVLCWVYSRQTARVRSGPSGSTIPPEEIFTGYLRSELCNASLLPTDSSDPDLHSGS
eukprot:13360231-Alexandrium_andersonii.AAC.1